MDLITKNELNEQYSNGRRHFQSLYASDLSGLDLRGCTFSDAVFSHANLTNTNLGSSTFIEVNFDNATLANTNFGGCTITNSTFKESFMIDTYLPKNLINDSDFSDAKINWADFSQTYFKNCNFRK